MPDSDICYGFVLGFLTAGVIGYILQRLALLRQRAGQANKRVTLVETKKSPREVYVTSVRAQTEIVVWIIVLFLLAVAAVWIFFGS